MIPLQRRELILELLERKGTVSLVEVFESLPVSHMTVRRDIKKLEEDGRVVSVAGGITLPTRMEFDLAHRVKRQLRSDAKEAIAHSAAQRVRSGDHVFLDAGTTSLAIAHAVLQSDLAGSYVTNDLEVANFVAEHTKRDVYLIGGQMDRANLSTQGAGAADSLGRHNIDLAFVSTSSFDLRGLSVPSEAKLVFKEAILRVSRTCILATDSSKYGKIAPFRSVPLTSFAEIHTDSDLHESAVEGMRELGLRVVLSVPGSAGIAGSDVSAKAPQDSSKHSKSEQADKE